MDEQPASVIDRLVDRLGDGIGAAERASAESGTTPRPTSPGPQRIVAYTARRVGLVVLAGVVAGAASYLISSASEPRFSATAKIAFVEDTRFDYVDAERDRLIGFAESTGGIAITAQEGIVGVDYVRPSLETFFDVEVQARTADLAAAAANDLAAVIVAGDLALRIEPIDRELDALAARNVELDAQIAELDELIAVNTRTEAFAESIRFDTNAAALAALTIELRESQDARNVAIRIRNQLQDLRGESVVRMAELELDRTAAVASTRVVRPGLVPTEPDGPSPSLVALIAALAVLVIGTTGLLLAAPQRALSADRVSARTDVDPLHD